MTKHQAFDYLVIRLADWFIEINNQLKSYADFNLQNNFGRDKLLLLPFIICTSNGHRKELFGMFDKFIPNEDGIVEEDLLNYESALFTTGLFNTVIINHTILTTKPGELTNEVLLNIIGVNNPETSLEFITYLNQSIDCIKMQLTLPDFINFTAEEISFYHKRHSSWRAFHGLPPEILEKYDGIIPTDFLISEKSVFAYSLQKRIFA